MQESKTIQRVCLADDDQDDLFLFAEAVRDVNDDVELSIADDGDTLMSLLDATVPPPDVLFLDLNMPRKNGLACLEEIRSSAQFNQMAVVIFSTSADDYLVQHAYEKGASLYIQKPTGYSNLKKMLNHCFTGAANLMQPRSRDNFLLQVL